MAGVNKVILVGRLGRDPEVRHTKTGDPVCTFSIATSERWKDKNGEQQEKTEWHRIVAWRKLAEICGEYLRKGKQVYIEGKLQTRDWEDKDGHKRYTTEVVANEMQMLDRRGEDSGNYNEDSSARGSSGGDPVSQATSGGGDDEIPF